MSEIGRLWETEYKLSCDIEWLEGILSHVDEYRKELIEKRAELQEVQRKLDVEEAKMAEEKAIYASSDADWQALDMEARLTGQRLRERRTARRF